MRMRVKRGGKQSFTGFDMGDGFYVIRETFGSCTEYRAMHLDAPGGYCIKRRSKAFGYRRDADAQIAVWKTEDAAQAA